MLAGRLVSVIWDFLTSVVAVGENLVFLQSHQSCRYISHDPSLLFGLRDTGLSLTTFNEHLKTYLFSVAFWDHGAFVTFMIYLRRL